MPLTDLAIRTAKHGDRAVKLYDERGLFLHVVPSGGKWWRFRYRRDGKEKLLSLGIYPDVSLKSAREKRDAARSLLAEGVDPSDNRKATKATRADRAANSFEVLAREWFAKQAHMWVDSHGSRIIRRLERDIFPWVGGIPVHDISALHLLEAVRRIETRGRLETAHRALQNCGQVLRYAVATGRATRDFTADLRGALPPVRGTHFAAVTNPEEVAILLKMLDSYAGSFVVACALQLAPLVFVRPGELRAARWADVDIDAAEWRFHVSKTDTQHIVPLSTQAVAILKELKALTGLGTFVFPGARSAKRPMSDNAVLAAMRRLDIPKDVMSGHGFRAMARTILDEELHFRPDLIEHQLAHAVRDPNGRAYNRTAYIAERKAMMQAWADYLDQVKTEASQKAKGRTA